MYPQISNSGDSKFQLYNFSSSKQSYSAPPNKAAVAWSVHIIYKSQVLFYSTVNRSSAEKGRLTHKVTLLTGLTLKKIIS